MRHDIRGSLNRLPRSVWLLAAVYTLASLWHFAHNAEYLAYYPNMPPWITREIVYAAWLAVASVGVVGAWLMWQGWLASGAGVMAAYGALGLDGLAHYGLMWKIAKSGRGAAWPEAGRSRRYGWAVSLRRRRSWG